VSRCRGDGPADRGTLVSRVVTEPAEQRAAVPGVSPDGRRPTEPRLPWVGLGLGVLALLLAILPWTGLLAAVVALVVSVVAWRRCARRRVPGADAPRGLGASQVATGLALSVLAITAVWTFVATVVPRPEAPAPLDCTSPTLDPADRITCQERP
jgi:hypothetical protein